MKDTPQRNESRQKISIAPEWTLKGQIKQGLIKLIL